MASNNKKSKIGSPGILKIGSFGRKGKFRYAATTPETSLSGFTIQIEGGG
jgi:hypothetical protein